MIVRKGFGRDADQIELHDNASIAIKNYLTVMINNRNQANHGPNRKAVTYINRWITFLKVIHQSPSINKPYHKKGICAENKMEIAVNSSAKKHATIKLANENKNNILIKGSISIEKYVTKGNKNMLYASNIPSLPPTSTWYEQIKQQERDKEDTSYSCALSDNYQQIKNQIRSLSMRRFKEMDNVTVTT